MGHILRACEKQYEDGFDELASTLPYGGWLRHDYGLSNSPGRRTSTGQSYQPPFPSTRRRNSMIESRDLRGPGIFGNFQTKGGFHAEPAKESNHGANQPRWGSVDGKISTEKGSYGNFSLDSFQKSNPVIMPSATEPTSLTYHARVHEPMLPLTTKTEPTTIKQIKTEPMDSLYLPNPKQTPPPMNFEKATQLNSPRPCTTMITSDKPTLPKTLTLIQLQSEPLKYIHPGPKLPASTLDKGKNLLNVPPNQKQNLDHEPMIPTSELVAMLFPQQGKELTVFKSRGIETKRKTKKYLSVSNKRSSQDPHAIQAILNPPPKRGHGRSARPDRFEAMWVRRTDCEEVINKYWNDTLVADKNAMLQRASISAVIQVQPNGWEAETTVNTLITETGCEWNTELIRDKFCADDAELILSISLGRGVEDKMVWHRSRKGDFSVRSAYSLHREIMVRGHGT
ncbi:hypothetical protein Salat_0205800 [Sesamum alatum]|uniref:Uncharacterized protein n=1 Tax=Sesamum alatum TaxID=300844 RepID=A0AAE1YZC0_9LAMI|nr:hypothetical protein Salat_0205800 [Sesamum alatum]